MSRLPSRSTMIAAFCLVLMVASASSQQPQPSGAFNQQPAETVPSSLSSGSNTNPSTSQSGQAQNARDWPLVNVDNANNKSVVDVHVPIFFDMVNQADKNTGNEKLDLSVMHGLVTVKKDKARNEKGELTGPVKVTVFGIPVYTSKGTPQEVNSRSLPEDSKRFEPLGANPAGNSPSLATQVKAMNERLTSSLSDLLERVAGNLRRMSSEQIGEQMSAVTERTRAGIKQGQANEVDVKLAGNRAI